METPEFSNVPDEPKKKFPTWAIVVIVLVVLCCCCAIFGYLAWTFGDTLLYNLGIY